MGFVKLYDSILDSSIWTEDNATRIVWVTMLVMADAEGIVGSTAPGISRRAGVPLDETRHALEVLEAPDLDSKSLAHEGRRIERIDGGYHILNFMKYRQFDYSTNREAVKKRKYRNRKKSLVRDEDSEAKAEAEAECPGHVPSMSPAMSPSVIKKISPPSPEASSLVHLFIGTLDEEFQKKAKPAELQKWGRAFDKLLQEFDLDRLKVMILFYRRDNFWADKFLSPLKLLRHDKDGTRYVDRFLQEMKGRANRMGDKKYKADFSTWDAIGSHDPEREAEVEAAAARELEAAPEPTKTAAERLEELRRGRDAMQPWDYRRGTFDREIERLTNQIAEGA